MQHTRFKVLIVILVSVCMIQCNKKNDFSSFNGAIKGTVKDADGNLLNGDLTSNNIIIRLLGQDDKATTDIRVTGTGEFTNLKMFPKNYKLWLEGPVVKSDTLTANLNGEAIQVKDFIVTPLISPKINKANVAGTSVSADYLLTANAGNIIEKKEIYCSTVPFPTASTGSRTNVYFTKIVTLSPTGNSVIIDALAKGTYYIRIGAKAKASVLMNYSNQVEVTIQ